ncbi:MAG TPA: superoxide dismutase family protein [Burkholderiales bacterium]|nr:superoxide dismutase family protein [Burkholderiales bacterium]
MGAGEDSIIGRSVVVHASRDDLTSQPAGNAGARQACGLISKSKDKWF